MPHPDDRTLPPADYGNTVHDDSLGRIGRHTGHDAKGFQHEYLVGGKPIKADPFWLEASAYIDKTADELKELVARS